MIHVTNLLLITHYSCNFNCKYCTQRELDLTQKLDVNKVFPFIDFLCENNDTKNLSIQFEGGETLFRWKDFIKPLVEYIEENTDFKVSYSLFTNGTVYTPELYDFLKYHNFKLVLSIDGNEQVFNLQRNAKFFTKVCENAKKFLTLPNTRINAVFTPETVNNLFDSYKFFVDLGATEICLTPDNRVDTIWDEDCLQNIKYQFNKILNADTNNYLVEQNALWNSHHAQSQKKNNHNNQLRIYPTGNISFSSDPFIRNELKTQICSLDNFTILFEDLIDSTREKQDFVLTNKPEVCKACMSRFICPEPKPESKATSPALCSMRVAYLINGRLENNA